MAVVASGMATLTIRKLDDGVYDRLRATARKHNRSIEAEASRVLDEGSRVTKRAGESGPNNGIDAIVDDLLEFHDRMVAKHGYLPDSVETIREIRRDE